MGDDLEGNVKNMEDGDGKIRYRYDENICLLANIVFDDY